MGALRAGGLTGLMNQPSAQVIDGSLRFDKSKSNYLNRTPSSSGNRKTWTWSGWVKFFGGTSSNPHLMRVTAVNTAIRFSTGKILNFYTDDGGVKHIRTNAVFRDTAWYHIVVACDTTQSTPSDRVKIYVNGELQTSLSTATYPSENFDTGFNSTNLHGLGAASDGTELFDGYLSQIYLIDGQALTPDSFGFTDSLTNTWRPKKYEGTFGTNGFYLPFDGNSPIGQDKSGSGNNFTPINFGGSVALDNPQVSGARPILNTTQGGAQAGVGVFGSKVGAYYAVTVASVGGGNRYHFDGVDRPNPTLIRGATYTFDQSDSSNGGGGTHPLRFSTTSDGTWGGGTEYTDGVSTNGTPGQAGAYTKITVPHDAPATLYYYCTNHSGMGSFTSQITDETKADKYASNCILALPLVGSNIDVSNSINSTSTTKVMTSNGNAAASSDTSNFYNGSFEFDGTGDYLTQDSTYTLGTGDFTVEAWIYTNTSNQRLEFWQNSSLIGGLVISTNFNAGDAGSIITRESPPGSSWSVLLRGNSVIKQGWNHCVWTRESGTLKFYVDGVLDTSSVASAIDSSPMISVGAWPTGTYSLNGYLQDVRVYKGVAKYTSDFVVPSTSPDILPDTPSGVSGSSKLTKITDGAVSFDGTGDYLTAPSSADYAFGTGDFTVECFVKNNQTSGNTPLTGHEASGTGSWSMNWYDGTFYWQASGSSNIISASSGSKALTGGWTHIAVTRSGTSLKFFINGVQEALATDSTDYNYTDALRVGATHADTSYLGFISNFRIVKGTALYTSDFTPPTEPLTNVTNTKLLCCQSNTSATEAAVKPGTITANGDAAATNFNPFITDINTVRGQETGYATLNPLINGAATLSDGNLTSTAPSGSTHGRGRSTLTMDTSGTGKFYFEATLIVVGGTYAQIGVMDSVINTDAQFVGGAANGYSYANGNGQIYVNGSGSSYGDTYTAGDTIGCSFDCGSGALRFYKNGVDQGLAATITADYHACFAVSNFGSNGQWKVNFGQKPFKFPPPDGFQPLNLANIRPETVIARPDKFVGVTTYTGTGATRHMNIGLQPDFVWIKQRNAAVENQLFDSVRGPGKRLQSDTANSEYSASNLLSSFNSDGFTLESSNFVNGTTSAPRNYVAWFWKAGGNKNTFNVDDVGYANASDVDMSVGSIRSAATNSAQTWSNNITTTGNSGNWWPTYPATHIFDADTSNYGHANGNGGACVVTLSFSPAITCNASVTFIGGVTSSGAGTISINGGTPVNLTTGSSSTTETVVPFSGSISSIVVTKTSTGTQGLLVYGFKIDGTRLTDNTAFNASNVPSIAATGCSVGTKQGFSIIRYVGNDTLGATVPHGLTQAPDFFVTKAIDYSNRDWQVYHQAIGNQQRIRVNSTGEASPANASFFNNTSPTASVVTFGNGGDANQGGETPLTYVMYAWHDVPGLQKFGAWSANGQTGTGGPYVHTGFKPSLILIKKYAGQTDNWFIFDTERDSFNVTENWLLPNTNGAESSDVYNKIDILSDGFAIRVDDAAYGMNVSNTSFIYAAWAETPSINLFGASSNAR